MNWGEPVISGDFTNDRPTTAEKVVMFGRQTDNHIPVVESLPGQATAMGMPVSVQIKATDADDDLLIYAAAGLPTGLAIGATSGLITGTPIVAGSFPVNVTVTDGKSPPVAIAFQ